MSLARGPTSSATRSRISPAALFVNVMARIEPGWALRAASRYAMRRVSTRVLPDPAPATMSSGPPSCTTAARWASLSPVRISSGSVMRRRGWASSRSSGSSGDARRARAAPGRPASSEPPPRGCGKSSKSVVMSVPLYGR